MEEGLRERKYLCLDVGGTSIKYAVCREDGDILSSGTAKVGKTLEEFLHYMAIGCVNVQFACDPEIIAIGGGISADPWIIEEIGRTYRELVKGQQMEYLLPRIVACEKGNDANLLGALKYFFELYP